MKAVINGSLTHYIDIGISIATPVIFIHGFPFSHKMWTFPGGQTEAIATTHRVIAYDIRGHGDSEVGDAQYTIEFFVDDLIGLMNHLNINSAVLVGLSMGGYIALRAVERHAERVRGLVLCDTAGTADSNEGKVRRSAAIRAIKTNGPRSFAETHCANIFAKDSFNARQETVAAIRSTIERTAPSSLCGTLLALASRTDTTAYLPLIAVPTLILVGEYDRLTPPEAAQAMKDLIPGSELHVVPRAAHMSNMEQPEEFNKHFVNFLAQFATLVKID